MTNEDNKSKKSLSDKLRAMADGGNVMDSSYAALADRAAELETEVARWEGLASELQHSLFEMAQDKHEAMQACRDQLGGSASKRFGSAELLAARIVSLLTSDPDERLDALSDEYGLWLRAQGMETEDCAMELMNKLCENEPAARSDEVKTQIAWLKDFCERWDEAAA